MQKYYDILGVNRSSSQDEIKKAFRKLAHIHHPDKPGGNASKFKELSEAYSYLTKNHTSQSQEQKDPFEGFSGFSGFSYQTNYYNYGSDNVRRAAEAMNAEIERMKREQEAKDRQQRYYEDEILRKAEEIKKRRAFESFRRGNWGSSWGA